MAVEGKAVEGMVAGEGEAVGEVATEGSHTAPQLLPGVAKRH